MNLPRPICYLWRWSSDTDFPADYMKLHGFKWRRAHRCWRRVVSRRLNSQLTGKLRRGDAVSSAEKEMADILWSVAKNFTSCPLCG